MASRRHLLSPQPSDELRRFHSAPPDDWEPVHTNGADEYHGDSTSHSATRLAAALSNQSYGRSSSSHNGAATDPALHDRALQQSAFGMDSSMWAAAFNLTNVITGSGIIGLPYAAQQCGLLVAVVLLLATAAATHYSLQLLVWSAHRLHRKRSLDVEDVMYEAFGPIGRWSAMAAVLFLDFGVMIALLIVIGDTVPPVCAHYLGPAFSALTSRSVVLSLVSVLVILPASSMRSLSSLSLISLTSILSVLLLTTLVIVRSFSAAERSPQSLSSDVRLFGPNVLSGFGSIAFVFVCHDVSLQLFQSLRVRSPSAWQRVSTASIGLALLPILLLTVVGYICFMDATKGNILNNFPMDDAAISVSRIVLALSMCMTYPSNLFMCRIVLTRAIAPSSAAGPSSSSLHYPLTVALFAVSLLVALRVDDLGVVQSIVGCVCAVSVAFLIPSACAVQVAAQFGQPYVSQANGGPFLIAALGLCIIALTIATQIAALLADEKSEVVHTAHVYY